MQVKKILGWAAAVILTVAAMGYGLHVAYADDAGRAIPTIGVTSPSPETVQVVWEAPGDTDTPRGRGPGIVHRQRAAGIGGLRRRGRELRPQHGQHRYTIELSRP